MTYNFDEVIERRGTDSVKWDGVKSVWGRPPPHVGGGYGFPHAPVCDGSLAEAS